jgi:hypothetical protein
MLPGDNYCPVCRTSLWAPDTPTIGSKKCPRCNAELWVLVGCHGPAFYLRQPGQSKLSFLATLAGRLYGKSTEEMEKMLKKMDSLDLVELVIEIESGWKPNRC